MENIVFLLKAHSSPPDAAFYPDVQEPAVATVATSYKPLTCAVMACRLDQRNDTLHTLRCLLYRIPMTVRHSSRVSSAELKKKKKTTFVAGSLVKRCGNSHGFSLRVFTHD